MVRDCGSFELTVQTFWTCFIVLHVEILPGVQLCLSERVSSGCAVSSVDNHQFEIVHCAARSSCISVLSSCLKDGVAGRTAVLIQNHVGVVLPQNFGGVLCCVRSLSLLLRNGCRSLYCRSSVSSLWVALRPLLVLSVLQFYYKLDGIPTYFSCLICVVWPGPLGSCCFNRSWRCLHWHLLRYLLFSLLSYSS